MSRAVHNQPIESVQSSLGYGTGHPISRLLLSGPCLTRFRVQALSQSRYEPISRGRHFDSNHQYASHTIHSYSKEREHFDLGRKLGQKEDTDEAVRRFEQEWLK